jgi:hypothetical protein
MITNSSINSITYVDFFEFCDVGGEAFFGDDYFGFMLEAEGAGGFYFAFAFPGSYGGSA